MLESHRGVVRKVHEERPALKHECERLKNKHRYTHGDAIHTTLKVYRTTCEAARDHRDLP